MIKNPKIVWILLSLLFSIQQGELNEKIYPAAASQVFSVSIPVIDFHNTLYEYSV